MIRFARGLVGRDSPGGTLVAIGSVFWLSCAAAAVAREPWPGETPPQCVGIDAERLGEIDRVVRQAIHDKKCPGAVVLVSRLGRIVWWRPYGQRLVGDDVEPMSRETVFDMASLTKVMATATSVMVLVERGHLSITDRVTQIIPEFGQNGKEDITIEQLLRHRAGFIADNAMADYTDGPERALERIWALKPIYEPGSKFLYTDVGYIVLGEIVRRVTGQPLDEFARQNVFEPLGMCDTSFDPDPFQRARTAPTEQRDGRWMRGDVHDPRAYLLGGVAGHAGLFSTARDVAIYANFVLNGTARNGCSIAVPAGYGTHPGVLSPATIAEMTSPGNTPAGQARGLGWDINTPFTSIRGDLFPVGGFGHTGFTGTSLWIDAASQTVIVILTNRVHPNGKGDVRELRRQIATIVAGAITDAPWSTQNQSLFSQKDEQVGPGPLQDYSRPAEARFVVRSFDSSRSAGQGRAEQSVLCGIDVLVRDGFRPLRGRRVGLITNHTGLDRNGQSIIDLLHAAPDVQLVALFSPEHGIRGQLDASVSDSRDEKTGLPVYSLYAGKRRKPTAEQLSGIDTLVFDIQDIGCRFYTYSATLGLCMEAAAENKLKFYVLDRPNAIGGELVEGPVLDAGRESFTGYHRIPVRHGMTLGELARLYNDERRMGVDLEVVQVEGWQRSDHFDATGLTWINPSPNMRSLRQAELYPGIGLLETTNISVGRGTDTPFEVIGAPWLDGRKLAAGLAGEELDGVVFVPVRFSPVASVHAKQECGGVQIIVTDRAAFRAVRTGLAIARQLRLLYSDDWKMERFNVLLASEKTLEAIRDGRSLDEIVDGYEGERRRFVEQRGRYLLYE